LTEYLSEVNEVLGTDAPAFASFETETARCASDEFDGAFDFGTDGGWIEEVLA